MPKMDSGSEERLARNEAIFREVNEAIMSGSWPGEDDARGAFRCECAHLGCNELIDLSVHEYERVRTSADLFVLAPGHERPEIEAVIEDHGHYLIVEKRGLGRRVAQTTDPRT